MATDREPFMPAAPRARAPDSTPGALAVSPAVIAAQRLRVRPPAGRQSRDTIDAYGMRDWYQADPVAGYPDDDRERLVRVFRHLAQRDEDMAGAIQDLLAIMNPGHAIAYEGSASATRAAKRELDAWLEYLYPEGGGLDGLINNQGREVYITGASSLEWFTDARRAGVEGVAIVPAETVRIRRDDAGRWAYAQVGHLPLGRSSRDAIPLHPGTYLYAAMMTDGASPYGTPIPIASLPSLDRKVRLTAGIDRIVNIMQKVALVTATVPTPTLADLGLETTRAPEYADRLGAYYSAMADLILENADEGFFLGGAGVDIKATTPSRSTEGVDKLQLLNERRVWSSVGTLAFMRGHMDATTEALAKVVYPILEALAVNMRQPITRQIEFGLNTHLRLCGIPARARLGWDQAKSAFALDDARAERETAETDRTLYDLFGLDWLPHAARRHGVTLGQDRRSVPAAFTEGSNDDTPTERD